MENIKSPLIYSLIFVFLASSILAFTLVPKRAEAFLGIGDFTFTTETFNIPELAWKILQSIVAKFINKLLEKVVSYVMSKIKKNFVIKDLLKYGETLSRQKYLFTYLNAYYPSSKKGDNNSMVKDLIVGSVNGFSNGGGGVTESNASRMTRLADNYRKQRNISNPQAYVRPLDSDYYMNIYSLADPYSDPSMWQIGAQDAALSAQGTADEYASMEIGGGDGLKTSYESTNEAGLTDEEEGDEEEVDEEGCEANAYPGETANACDVGDEDSSAGIDWNKVGKNLGAGVLNPPAEVQGLLTNAQGAIFKKIAGDSGGSSLTNAIGDFVANLAMSFLTNAFKGGKVISESSFTIRATPLNMSGTGTRTDSTFTAAAMPTTDLSSLVHVPDYCSAASQGSATTNLGSGSVTADGGEGGGGGSSGEGNNASSGGGGGEGGSGSANLNLQGGSISAGSNAQAQCNSIFPPSQANSLLNQMNATSTDTTVDSDGDGVPDSQDACPTNPDKVDYDPDDSSCSPLP